MHQYKLIYETDNHYKGSISDAIFDFNVIPENSAFQHRVNLDIQCESGFSESLYTNSFSCKILRLRMLESVESLKLSIQSEVIRRLENPFLFDLAKAVQSADNRYALDYKLKHHQYLEDRDLTRLSKAYFRKVPVYKSGENISEWLSQINEWVHKSLNYKSNTSRAGEPLSEVLVRGSGVCQDFSHLLLHLLRLQNFPARYVSGYLNQDANLLGAAYLHAWVEVHFPEIGWIGVDPTNNVWVDSMYVKVSHGRDYLDCQPIRGVFRGSQQVKNHYIVHVQEQ